MLLESSGQRGWDGRSVHVPRQEMINEHKILVGKVEQEGGIAVDPGRK
jgi:hypothetical protein